MFDLLSIPALARIAGYLTGGGRRLASVVFVLGYQSSPAVREWVVYWSRHRP
jgi:hypothetical protein